MQGRLSRSERCVGMCSSGMVLGRCELLLILLLLLLLLLLILWRRHPRLLLL